MYHFDITITIPKIPLVSYALIHGSQQFQLPANVPIPTDQFLSYLDQIRYSIFDPAFLVAGSNLYSRLKTTFAAIRNDIAPTSMFIYGIYIIDEAYFEQPTPALSPNGSVLIDNPTVLLATAVYVPPPTSPVIPQDPIPSQSNSIHQNLTNITKFGELMLQNSVRALLGKKIIVIDSEIKKAILGVGEVPIPGIEYCAGWTDYQGMGIATIGVYNFYDDTNYVFMDDNIQDFQALVDQSEVVVGFNNIGFDNKLFNANGLHVPDEKSYDLLLDIAISRGFPLPHTSTTHRGYGLNKMAKANLGIGKTDYGPNAPVYFQTEQFGKLLRYQMGDVDRTRQLFIFAIAHQALKNPQATSLADEWIPLQTIAEVFKRTIAERVQQDFSSLSEESKTAMAREAAAGICRPNGSYHLY